MERLVGISHIVQGKGLILVSLRERRIQDTVGSKILSCLFRFVQGYFKRGKIGERFTSPV